MNRLSLVLLLLSGCLANNSLDTMTMAVANISNLTRISPGMNESEVLQIMHRPYSKEKIQYEGDTFDFWFYVTRPTGLDQNRLLHQNLTPLAFKNGILIGWGFNYYNYIVKQEKIEANQKKQSSVEEEDVNLEKALEAPPSSKGEEPNQQRPSAPPKTEPIETKPPAKSPSKPTPKQASPGMPAPKPKPLELGPPSQTPQSTSQVFFPLNHFLAQSDDEENGSSQEMTPETGNNKKNKAPGKAKPPEEKRDRLDEEDEQMIQKENEQNFDFW